MPRAFPPGNQDVKSEITPQPFAACLRTIISLSLATCLLVVFQDWISPLARVNSTQVAIVGAAVCVAGVVEIYTRIISAALNAVPSTTLTQYLFWSCVLVAAVVYIAIWRPWGIDDAWITYRYARNIADGHGYVYNFGEHVQGTSTPLYTLILAVLGWCVGSGHIPQISAVISGLAFIAIAALVFALLNRSANIIAATCGSLLVITNWQISYTCTLGMETSTYLALILGSFYAYLVGRDVLALWLAVLCALTRLDGALVPVLIGLSMSIERRAVPWRIVLGPACLYGLWLLFAQYYFGHILPQSMLAKEAHVANVHWSFDVGHQIFANVSVAVLAIAGTIFAALRRSRMLLLGIWVILYVAAYSYVAFYPYIWYAGPGIAIVIIMAAFLANVGEHPASSFVRSTVAIAILVCSGFFASNLLSKSAKAICDCEHARWSAAQSAARYVHPTDTNCSGGIGMIGWFTGAYIVDFAGLVSPAIAAHITDGVWPYDYVFQQFPRAYYFDSDISKLVKGKYHRLVTVSNGPSNFELVRLN